MKEKTTDKLDNELEKTQNIADYLSANKSEFISSAIEYMNELLIEKNLKKADVAKNSNLHRTYVYEIFNGDKLPSRDKIIAIAFGMTLNLEETQKLLKRSGYRELYSRDIRDSVIIFALNKKMNLLNCNNLLDSFSWNILK